MHARRGPRRHRGDQRVVGVEHRDPVVGQRLDELALGCGDLLLGAELAEVRLADVEHQRDVGRRDRAELGDVPDAAGAHLEDQVAGVGCRPAARSAAARARC